MGGGAHRGVPDAAGLDRIKVDERASKSLGAETQITKWVSGLTFWLFFIVVLVWRSNFAQALCGRFTGCRHRVAAWIPVDHLAWQDRQRGRIPAGRLAGCQPAQIPRGARAGT
jgi:hypothetical protein